MREPAVACLVFVTAIAAGTAFSALWQIAIGVAR